MVHERRQTWRNVPGTRRVAIMSIPFDASDMLGTYERDGCKGAHAWDMSPEATQIFPVHSESF